MPWWCAVLLTLFIGLLFLQCGNDQRSIYARIAFVFFLVAIQALVTVVYSVLTCKHTALTSFPPALSASLRLCHAAGADVYGLDVAPSAPLTDPCCPVLCSAARPLRLTAARLPVRCVSAVTEERALFTRERSCHVYRTSAYFLSKATVEVPMQIALSFLLGSIGYFMVGLSPSASHFLRFSLGLALLALASNSLGQVLGALAPTPLMAVMLSPLCVIPFMLLSGFFLNVDDIPVYLLPLRALSPHLYTFTSLFAVEFTGLTLHCADDEALPIWVGEAEDEFCYLVRGEQVLSMFHIGEDSAASYWANMGYVALLFVGFRLLALAALKVRARQGQADEDAEDEELRSCARTLWRMLRCKRMRHSR